MAANNIEIIDEEVKWDKLQTIISKTDNNGTILYMNDAFEASSEYTKIELIGEPQNIIRHPDMPKIIFKKLWESLKKGENYHAIIKNRTKTGRYYWVITDFTIEKNDQDQIIGYTGRRKAISQSIINKISPLYTTILQIEKFKGEEASESYFNAYLKEEINKNYNEFVVDLFENEISIQQEELKAYKKNNKDSLVKRLFFTSYD